MLLFRTLGATICAAVIAAAAVLSSGTTANAATLAIAAIDGKYSFETPSGGSTTFSLEGSFSADIVGPITPGLRDYEFSASLNYFGEDPADDFSLAGSVTEQLDLVDVWTALSPLLDGIILNAGSPIATPDGTLTYGGSLTTLTATSVSGVYTVLFEFLGEADDIPPGSFLAGALPPGIDPLIGTLPNNETGSFEASFAIAAVPLPAGLPLLAAALGGLVVLRRRQAA